LFTDLEGSTRLWEEHPEAMRDALARHDAVVRRAIESHGGQVVKTTGDGFHAAFATAPGAVDAAIAAQLGLMAESWSETGSLRVRMGVHTGSAEIRDGDYYGTALNRAARLMSVAHGGQIVVSLATSELIRDTGTEVVDLGEHRLRDLGHAERIFQVTHVGLQVDFPPLRSVERFPTNLPLQTTSFIGRDEDMADVIEALGQVRVVTLTGVGGVGKTRLAVQVAAELLEQFRDGAWMVELGPLSDPEGMPEVIAAALAISPRQGRTMADSVVDALRDRELLVVFDNCEHVITTAARTVDAIVRACPAVRVLATSREGLGLRGERQITVPSLDLADASIQLFADRSREASGRFELDDEVTAAIGQICSRLDGIPLAIELAAARTRMMTPAEIAARLDERFRLLTGGSRTAVERHQTLRQAVDWSYDLLSPLERAVLDCLGVFAGGFTLDAAEIVVACDAIERFQILDGITQLVDKSLVVVERAGDETRYRLLETIRQYALERLDDLGATDAVRRRHAEWCATFMGDASIGLRERDELRWVARLRRELDNLRAGITWAAEVDDADLALRQLGDHTAITLSQRTEGYRLCPLAAVALTTTGVLDHPRAAMALTMRGVDHLHHDEVDDAERDAHEAIQLIRQGSSELLVEPWVVLMLARVARGTIGPPSDNLDEFLRATSTLGDPFRQASATGMLASWYLANNQLDEAVPYAEQAMELATALGNTSLTTMALFALGGALMQRDPNRARQLLLESVDLGRQVGNDFFVGMALGRIARIGADASDPVWARQFRDALDAAVTHDDRRNAVVLLDSYLQALVTTGRHEQAALLFGYVQEHARHVHNPYSKSAAERVLFALTTALGEAKLATLRIEGAALEFDQAVNLASAELDRAITTAGE
jgi:predicted ATPase/class 3 adenylate cyclase